MLKASPRLKGSQPLPTSASYWSMETGEMLTHHPDICQFVTDNIIKDMMAEMDAKIIADFQLATLP